MRETVLQSNGETPAFSRSLRCQYFIYELYDIILKEGLIHKPYSWLSWAPLPHLLLNFIRMFICMAK